MPAPARPGAVPLRPTVVAHRRAGGLLGAVPATPLWLALRSVHPGASPTQQVSKRSSDQIPEQPHTIRQSARRASPPTRTAPATSLRGEAANCAPSGIRTEERCSLIPSGHAEGEAEGTCRQRICHRASTLHVRSCLTRLPTAPHGDATAVSVSSSPSMLAVQPGKCQESSKKVPKKSSSGNAVTTPTSERSTDPRPQKGTRHDLR